MKHFLEAMKQMVPGMAPVIDAMQKDIAEQEAEFERRTREHRERHDQMRRESAERRARLLDDRPQAKEEMERKWKRY